MSFPNPLRLCITLNSFYDRYQKLLFNEENGLGSFDTSHENGYVKDDDQYIMSMKAAIEEDGVELLGYTSLGCVYKGLNDCIITGNLEEIAGYHTL